MNSVLAETSRMSGIIYCRQLLNHMHRQYCCSASSSPTQFQAEFLDRSQQLFVALWSATSKIVDPQTPAEKVHSALISSQLKTI